MVHFVTDSNQVMCEWIAKRIKGFTPESFQPCSTLGIMRQGKIIAALAFNNFQPMPRDIHLTIAAESPAWASRKVLRQIFNYIFIQMGCLRTTVMIAKNNKRARKLAEGVGYKYEGNLRKGFDGINDAMIYGMLHNECRWLGEQNG